MLFNLQLSVVLNASVRHPKRMCSGGLSWPRVCKGPGGFIGGLSSQGASCGASPKAGAETAGARRFPLREEHNF